MTTYPGGKNGSGVYQAIVNLMPPHNLYVEAFLGGGAIMRMKRPAIASIGIDSDSDVIANWEGHYIPVPGLTLLCTDALYWLANITLPADTLVYCDPPYLMHTRSSQRSIYRCELSDEQHAELLRLIRELRCMVMISGYWSKLYAEALSDWRSVHFQARTRGGKMATEWVWMNFPEPAELHDYRYLGSNFRERERIKRKVKRWQARLARMNVLERHALMLALGSAPSETALSTSATPEPEIAAALATADDG